MHNVPVRCHSPGGEGLLPANPRRGAMLFNSTEFLLCFLPLVVAVYYVLPWRARAAWLALASYFFYGWWRVDCVGLMLALTAINYAGGLGIARAKGGGAKRAWLVFAIVGSLGVLGYFKYVDFLIRTWNGLAVALGTGDRIEPLGVLLPIGISFYTFQSMSYPIDIYRGVSRPARRLVDFACYVSLFPQLIAGPIVRYREIADQLAERTHTADKFARGLVFFVVGLAKKVLLADALAAAAGAAFDHGAVGLPAAWLGLLAYGFQIYFDFSGYSDMAVGLGLMFGFEFPQNFDSPYRAVGVRDFWRRWHMSLSRWLRDYLYIPLGGSRQGTVRLCASVLITFFLGGLWHGAHWTFVLWGIYYAALIGAEHAVGRVRALNGVPVGAKRAATFVLVLLGWVLFRSATVADAGVLYGGLFGAQGWGALPAAMRSVEFAAVFVLCAAIAWCGRNLWAWQWRITARTALWVLPLFAAGLYKVLTTDYSPFLYFQF
ncbi:MAG: MBOAT family protein [Candidatus Brocadiae bacterium]|nr:MBOAT family protein [Candidatus Brocadiia bacterium]